MKYVARHYIRLGGEVITPGELLDVADEEKAAWLRSAGAIEPFWGGAQEAEAADGEDEEDEEDAQEASSESPAPAPQIDASEGIVRPAKKGRSRA